MAQPQRIALVTGANKGIGLEICRQFLQKDLKVVLTARDEARGKAAVKKLQEEEGKDVIFHKLDIADSASVASLKEFVQTQFGRLDILINNAGVGGVELDPKVFSSSNQPTDLESIAGEIVETFEIAKECVEINYYGTKRMCGAFIPLLELSPSPRIVNLTSFLGKLRNIPSEEIKSEIRNADNLTEERLDELVETFLNDFKSGERFKESGWPATASAYKVSKIAVSAYTRIIAKKHPKICVNCVHPGFVKTDMSWNMGPLPVEEGAKGPVVVALLPDRSPSGQFYDRTELSSFE
ncbi:hypothetical protein LUZ60_009564 [Juncus effusus]|nr:hypothetical protein LUZ60_009564 [Juncus effusus]